MKMEKINKSRKMNSERYDPAKNYDWFTGNKNHLGLGDKIKLNYAW